MRYFALLAAIALLGVAEAQQNDAADVGVFYNRPGVSLEQAETDARACAEFAAQVVVSNPAAPNLGLVGAVLVASLDDDEASPTDDCMIARGYRRFQVAGESAEAFASRLSALPVEQRAALVSVETPIEGVLVRRPSNNYWLTNDGETPITPREFHPVVRPQAAYGGWPRSARQNANLSPSADEAVIVGSIRSTTGDLVVAEFMRVEPDTGQLALLGRNQSMTRLYFMTRSRQATPMALVAPAGTYALTNLDMLPVCLGTFAFTVAPGEVVDLGVISINEEPISGPDPLGGIPKRQIRIDAADPDLVRQALSRTPELAARARRAEYFNGVQFECASATIPGMIAGVTMPGAPYRDSASPVAGR